MTNGIKELKGLSNEEKDDLLKCIIQDCTSYSDDYHLLGEEVIKDLVMFGLLNYGDKDKDYD